MAAANHYSLDSSGQITPGRGFLHCEEKFGRLVEVNDFTVNSY